MKLNDEYKLLIASMNEVTDRVERLEGAVHQLLDRFESPRLLNSNHEEHLDVKGAARLLGKSEKTIRRWASREHEPLPAIKIFCNEQYSWSFKKSELLDWFSLYQQN